MMLRSPKHFRAWRLAEAACFVAGQPPRRIATPDRDLADLSR